MSVMDTKSIKSLCHEIQSIWWIENPTFRKKYNNYVSAALAKGYETGDFGALNRILKATPDKRIKLRVTNKIINTLPLAYREKTESIVKDHKRWEHYTAQDFQDFVGIGISEFIEGKDDKIIIDKVKIDPSEFVDFMLDTITLNRNHFSMNDLEKIDETLSLIKGRLETVKKQTAKRA